MAANQVGIYHWSAKYNGDSNNKAVSDNGVNEAATVNPDPKAQITPTGTTAQQFANGTAQDLPAVFYSGTGTIGQNVNPGVFFYYSFVFAPNAGPFTITISETNTSTNNAWPFLIHQGQIGLYNASGTTFITGGTDLGHGSATITANATAANQEFIVSVKYDSKSIAGGPLPIPATVQYTWTTWVSGVAEATAGVQLTPMIPGAGPMKGPIAFFGSVPTPNQPAPGASSPGTTKVPGNKQIGDAQVVDYLFSQDLEANDLGTGLHDLLAKLGRTGHSG